MIWVISLVFVLIFWGTALWIYLHRDRPDALSNRVPFVRKYREGRLRPLFRNPSDVVWLAAWLFFVGLIFLLFLIVNLFRP